MHPTEGEMLCVSLGTPPAFGYDLIEGEEKLEKLKSTMRK